MCDSRFDPVIKAMGLALVHPTFIFRSLSASTTATSHIFKVIVTKTWFIEVVY